MPAIFLPKTVIDNLKLNDPRFTSLSNTLGEEVEFSKIQEYAKDFRNKLIQIADFLRAKQDAPTQVDLTDECISIFLNGDQLRTILNEPSGGFKHLVALLSVVDGHLTFSILGADDDENKRAISKKYKIPTAGIKGLETWPRRGLLAITQEFNNVINCE